MQTIAIILGVLLLFNMMILAHEAGHFWAARWRGMVVKKFGIWFGKPIWKRTFGGVEYSLGWIPAGGFVSLPQMATMETIEGKAEGAESAEAPIASARPLDKIIVAAAGPVASMLLAVVLSMIVWVVGYPVPSGEMSTVVGWVTPDGPAAKAGIEPGDDILSVDGKVDRFTGMGGLPGSIQWNVAKSTSPLIEVGFKKPDGRVVWAKIAPTKPEREGWGRIPLKSIGLGPAETPVIARVLPNSPAEKAGLKVGDALREINGKPVFDSVAVGQMLEDNNDSPVSMVWERKVGDKTEAVRTTVRPKKPEGDNQYLIGLVWDPRGATTMVHPSPLLLIASSTDMIFKTFQALFTPESDVKAEHLTGPVGIIGIYYLLFETPDGWRLALWFSVVLNVNLALLNLLPLPVLDGGHIALSLIEAVRRKPLPSKFVQIVQTGFALFLIGYLVYISFFDIHQLMAGKQPSASTTQTQEGYPVFKRDGELGDDCQS